MTASGCNSPATDTTTTTPNTDAEKKGDVTIYGEKGAINPTKTVTTTTLKGDYYEIPMEDESDTYVVNPDKFQPHKLQKEVNVLKGN